MSKLFSRATVTGATLTGASLKATLTALWDALSTAGLSDVNRATVTATSTLTVAQCGLLLIDATSGNIVLTLPASGAISDDAIFQARRLDSTANTVTIQRAGTDTVNSGVSILLPASGNTQIQLPAGAVNWRAFGAAAAGANTDIISTGNNTSTVYTTAGTATAYTITPNPAITAYTAGQAHQVLFSLASGLNPTLQISGMATPPNLVMQKADGTYINAVGIPLNHRSLVTLLSATQALVVTMPPVPALGLEFLHVRDEKATTNNAGASAAGNQTRTLNTVVTNTITGASLAANAVTLPAGTYRIFASAPAANSSSHRVRLLNTTDAAVALFGTSEYAAASTIQTSSIIEGRIVIAAAKTFNLQHFIGTAQATFGLGVAVSDTFIEVYATLMIWKE